MPYYFKVVAVNAGGESPAPKSSPCCPSGGAKQVLIVNGFDRLDRTLNPTQPADAGGPVDRVAAAAEQLARLRRAGRRGDSGGGAWRARRQHEQRSGHQPARSISPTTTP